MIAIGVAVSYREVSFTYGFDFSIEGLTLDVPEGTLFGLIGPNGCGKTTLLSLLLKFLKPLSGSITVFGQDVRNLSAKSLARLVAYIAQDFSPTYDYSVEEIVEMGGISRASNFFDTRVYQEDLEEALRIVDLIDYRARPFSMLSGGQQRRALIARAIYQKTPVIVADELTNHLDIGQAIKVMDYLKTLSDTGKTILATFHDIGLAGKYCDLVAVMKNGRLLRVGKPSDVLTHELIKSVYGAEVTVIPHPHGGYPVITY